MIIKQEPRRSNSSLVVNKVGDMLTINDVDYDFSVIPDGATLPNDGIDCEWVSGDIHRINGEIEITLIVPHGPSPTQEQAFPQDIVNPDDGVIIDITQEIAQ